MVYEELWVSTASLFNPYVSMLTNTWQRSVERVNDALSCPGEGQILYPGGGGPLTLGERPISSPPPPHPPLPLPCRTGQCTVVISVLAIITLPPLFNNPTPNVSIMETTPPGTFLYTFQVCLPMGLGRRFVMLWLYSIVTQIQ